MGIAKIHPIRRWLIEKLGGSVSQVHQRTVVNSVLMTDDTATAECMIKRAREQSVRALMDDLVRNGYVQFQEWQDGIFWRIIVSVDLWEDKR